MQNFVILPREETFARGLLFGRFLKALLVGSANPFVISANPFVISAIANSILIKSKACIISSYAIALEVV
ncbi:hypothetical protein [Nostoc sp.]|uniref:hypothetical protein n=1 Tax=Nostoc sp. TaxID=1180 RepID=UPI002FFB70D1